MEGRIELVVGYHPVSEALRAGRRRLGRLRLRQGLRHPDAGRLRAVADCAGVPVEELPLDQLRKGVAEGTPDQGFVLEAGPLPVLGLERLLALPPGPAGVRHLVALDGVEDPRNLGAVARVAEASGVLGMLLASRHAAALSPVASRASAGALEHLPVARVPNLSRALRALREAGFWTIGADSEQGQDCFATPERLWAGDLALILGSEGRGLRPGVARQLDHRLRIPLQGRVASLNVASAAAVLLFEAARRARPWSRPPRGEGSSGPVIQRASPRN